MMAWGVSCGVCTWRKYEGLGTERKEWMFVHVLVIVPRQPKPVSLPSPIFVPQRGAKPHQRAATCYSTRRRLFPPLPKEITTCS